MLESPHSKATAAYTLLEVILALSLAAVILGLVTMAIHINLSVADKSQAQVEEAQLARALLQRMAEDLRNAVPFRPSPTSSTASTTSTSATSSAASASTSPTASPDSTNSADTESTQVSVISTESITGGGICGSSKCLFIETSRRPRPNRWTAMLAADNAEPVRMSDIRTVTYSLGDPSTLSPDEQGASMNSMTSGKGGLYRREMDRAEFNWAIRQGETDALNLSTELLAPEVVELLFAYYDGAMLWDSWDSTAQGKLPDAVKITIVIRRPSRTSSRAVETIDDTSQWVTYDMIVDLPNSQVEPQASSQESQGSATPSSDAAKSDASKQSSSNDNASGNSAGGATKASDTSRGSNR